MAKNLKFKGRGHEVSRLIAIQHKLSLCKYSDIARLLSFYQLWLDDLFPKAKFLDALAMVEKLGHKKRMQLMRMDWINEGKPKPIHEDLFDDPVVPLRENTDRDQAPTRIAPIFESKKFEERLKTPEDFVGIYDATPMALRTQVGGIGPAEGDSLFGPRNTAPVSDEPEDDLDALLEQEMGSINPSSAADNQGQAMEVVEHDFVDDMEAMAEMDGVW
jgi:replication fork protection complex subunit Csm3/Swi3